MRRAVFYSAMLAVAAVGAGAGSIPRVSAQDSKAAAAPATPTPETEDEIKERKIRRVCKSALCATLHMQRPASGDLTCSVQKTWRKEVLTKILSRAKVPWPWGYARCASDVKLDRATLIKAMTEPEFEAQFEKHDLRCELEGEKEKYEVKLQISPKVTFKQGKAVKASLNWGKIEGPKIAQTALWPVTAADNSFGILQGVVVDDINEFVQARCTETNGEWQAK